MEKTLTDYFVKRKRNGVGANYRGSHSRGFILSQEFFYLADSLKSHARANICEDDILFYLGQEIFSESPWPGINNISLKRKETLLFLAVKVNYLKVVKVLIANGADAGVKNEISYNYERNSLKRMNGCEEITHFSLIEKIMIPQIKECIKEEQKRLENVIEIRKVLNDCIMNSEDSSKMNKKNSIKITEEKRIEWKLEEIRRLERKTQRITWGEAVGGGHNNDVHVPYDSSKNKPPIYDLKNDEMIIFNSKDSKTLCKIEEENYKVLKRNNIDKKIKKLEEERKKKNMPAKIANSELFKCLQKVSIEAITKVIEKQEERINDDKVIGVYPREYLDFLDGNQSDRIISDASKGYIGLELEGLRDYLIDIITYAIIDYFDSEDRQIFYLKEEKDD